MDGGIVLTLDELKRGEGDWGEVEGPFQNDKDLWNAQVEKTKARSRKREGP